jgi:tetratricopeptide (TPR) repeat protein
VTVVLSRSLNGIWLALGGIFAGMGNRERAIKLFDRVLWSDPKNYGAWKGKSDLYQKMGRYDDSLKYLDELIDFYPEDGRAWHNFTCQHSLAFFYCAVL